MPPCAWNPNQVYRYLFTIYRDLGPKREMVYLRPEYATGLTRRDAAATLKLAPDERVVRTR